MAMHIEREGTGYRIRLTGDRSRIWAHDPGEIGAAVEHYYTGHTQKEYCPICRVIDAKQFDRGVQAGSRLYRKGLFGRSTNARRG